VAEVIVWPEELTPALQEVLGTPNFQLAPVWRELRRLGQDIPQHYEEEMAAALFFLIPFAIKHGADWWKMAVLEIDRRRKEKGL
jgi:hypothetical protein